MSAAASRGGRTLAEALRNHLEGERDLMDTHDERQRDNATEAVAMIERLLSAMQS
jgi:hypothetical protein